MNIVVFIGLGLVIYSIAPRVCTIEADRSHSVSAPETAVIRLPLGALPRQQHTAIIILTGS